VQYIVTSESNTKGGDLAGVEVTYQTRFHFLPGILRDFGVYLNYAYVESNIHEVARSATYIRWSGRQGTSELDLVDV